MVALAIASAEFCLSHGQYQTASDSFISERDMVDFIPLPWRRRKQAKMMTEYLLEMSPVGVTQSIIQGPIRV